MDYVKWMRVEIVALRLAQRTIEKNIASSLLYYVRSGDVYVGYGALRVVGIDGYIWPRTSRPDARSTYNLSFYGSGVRPSDYSARCVAFLVWHDFSNSHSCESLKMYKQG